MSFINYPASLPHFSSLASRDELDKLISELGYTDRVETLKVSHPFMDAFDKVANVTLTDNGALTHKSTNDACLDLYYGIAMVSAADAHAMLTAAWNQDPLTTLHIIFYARSIHRGKSLATPFFLAYGWLLQNQPKTALANLKVLVEGTIRTNAALQASRRDKGEDWEMVDRELLEHVDFKSHGCWKDLNTLLTIYIQGQISGPSSGEYLAVKWPRKERNEKQRRITRREQIIRYNLRCGMTEERAKEDVEKNKVQSDERNKRVKQEASDKRHQVRQERNATVSRFLKVNKTYRALHYTIANLYADQLKKDMAQLEKNKAANLPGRYAHGHNLSLAAKWAPSLGRSHDKHTFLATSIAELLFPPAAHQDAEESREHYLNKVRELYRKEYLTPLRSALDVTEHYMQEGQWEKVDLRHMPSVCLQQNLALFFKHAQDTVMAYMEQVAADKKKVAGATLGPHELVHRVRTGGLNGKFAKLLELGAKDKLAETQKQLVNGQWTTLIESIRDTSLLKKHDGKAVDLGECLAICDVSGSMMSGNDKHEEQPLNAAIGLSLVVTNLAKPPFKGGIITFTNNPHTFHIDTKGTFTDQVNTISRSDVGYNTDLCKVFTDCLLPMALKYKLAPEDMVKRLFIFTDMEFDSTNNGMEEYLTTHEFIKKQYADNGYEMPHVVWWNLCNNRYTAVDRMHTPVTMEEKGVSLLSGFSASMIKTFLDGDITEQDKSDVREDITAGDLCEETTTEEVEKEVNEDETAVDFMKKAVYHESFKSLAVV